MNTDRTECRAVEDLLVALAAGELESEHAAQLRAHLDDCADCQAEFARITRTAELAEALKLESPEIDRYPEFLRRLAASEAPSAGEAGAIALASVERDMVPVETGVAAVIPLFGNRVTVRNGFGQGFELRVASSQGNQWLHLSAKSLMRVASIAAGISLAAGISAVALLLIFSSFFSRGKTSQASLQDPQRTEAQPLNGEPNFPPRRMEEAPWIQTASNAQRTLVIWKENAQLQAGWIEHNDRSLSNRFPLQAPVIGNRQPLPPRMAECAIATDGKDFLLLREIEGAIYLWRLEPQTSSAEKDRAVVSPPTLLSRKGAQPDIAWIGDRYVAVWVAPDLVAPVIELIELGRDGRALQTTATVVATTEGGGKVGLPGITGRNGQLLVTYFVRGGVLMARTFTKTGEAYDSSEPINIGGAEGPHHMPIHLFAIQDGFLACWDVMNSEGAEIRLARLDQRGKLLGQRSLVRARTPITSYDLKVAADGKDELMMLWSEVQPGGALTFTQNFSFDGDALNQPQNIFVADSKPAAVAFGDASGRLLVWPEFIFADKVPVGIKPIGRNE